MKFKFFQIILFVCCSCLLLDEKIVYSEGEVPLYIKYRYEKTTGRKWYDASPQRQQAFVDEMLKKKEEEKIKKLLQQTKIDNENQREEIARAQKKLNTEIREQNRKIASENKKLENEKRKMEIRLKKQEMKMKMERLRTKQDQQR